MPAPAVIFDLWDTLTDPDAQRNRRRSVMEVGELLGAGGEAFATLVADTFPRRCRGELGDLDATLRTLCRELAVEPTVEQLEAAAIHRMQSQAQLLQLRDDAIPTVERFRRHGWKVGLLTDSTCETALIWRELEVSRLFDAAVFSCVEGRAKPDPGLYEAIAARLQVAPADCVYVADGRSNELTGAAAAGMRPVKIDVGDAATEPWAGECVRTLAGAADVVLGLSTCEAGDPHQND